MRSIDAEDARGSKEEFARAVTQYSVELSEPPHVIHQALTRLLLHEPTLNVHPVASGLLASEIAALRGADQETREPPAISLLGLIASIGFSLTAPAASTASPAR